MEFRKYRIKDKKIVNSNDVNTDVNISDFIKNHDYLDIGKKNGCVAYIEKNDENLSFVLITPSEEVIITESADEFFTEKELREISYEIAESTKIKVCDASYSEIKETIENISVFNYMQKTYELKADDSIFGLKCDPYVFISSVNSYFEQTKGSELDDLCQKIVYVDLGDMEGIEESRIMHITQKSSAELFFIKTNCPELTAYEAVEKEDGSHVVEEIEYNKHQEFFDRMDDISNNDFMTKANFAYLMDNMEENRIVNKKFFNIDLIKRVKKLLGENKGIVNENKILDLAKFCSSNVKRIKKASNEEIEMYRDAIQGIRDLITDKEILEEYSIILDNARELKNKKISGGKTFNSQNSISKSRNSSNDFAKELVEYFSPVQDEASVKKANNEFDEMLGDRSKEVKAEKSKENTETVARLNGPKLKEVNEKYKKRRYDRVVKFLVAGTIVALAVINGPRFIAGIENGDTKNPISITTADVEKFNEEDLITVYRKPGRNSKIAGYFKKGDDITIYENAVKYIADDNSKWVEIDKNRWINSDDVVFFYDTIDTRGEADAVNVRANTYTDSEIVGTIENGTTVELKSERIITRNNSENNKFWYKVDVEKENNNVVSGYVSARYIRGVYVANPVKNIEKNSADTVKQVVQDNEER